MLPRQVGMPSRNAARQSTFPARAKEVVLTTVCSRIPTRLVPLATVGGKPNMISTGKVMAEPLPASVLMNPARKPATTTTR